MHNFKELKVWQTGREFVSEIYRLTRQLPPEELYVLNSQMRRAAISIPSNISEGAGRNSEKDFDRYINKVQMIQKMLYNFRSTLSK